MGHEHVDSSARYMGVSNCLCVSSVHESGVLA